MGLLSIRVTTQRDKLICAVLADRAWRTVDVKEGVESQTGITVDEQRLFAGGEDLELPNRERLCNLFPETQDVVSLRLVRRPLEQAQWLGRVMQHGLQIREAPAHIRDDHDVVHAAVRRNWKALEYASERLRADREIVLTAVAKGEGNALSFVPDLLWADSLFVMNVVQVDGKLLKRAAPALAGDRAVVKAAILHDWQALEFASAELKADRETLLEALRHGGWDAMRYAQADARERAKADLDMMLLAVQHDWRAVAHCEVLLGPGSSSETARAVRAVALAAVQQDWRALAILGPWARSDHQVLLACAAQDLCALTLALEEFPVEKDVVLAMVRRSPHVLAYLPPHLLADEEIIAAAVAQDWPPPGAADDAELTEPEDARARALRVEQRLAAEASETEDEDDEDGEEEESDEEGGDAAAAFGATVLSEVGSSTQGRLPARHGDAAVAVAQAA